MFLLVLVPVGDDVDGGEDDGDDEEDGAQADHQHGHPPN